MVEENKQIVNETKEEVKKESLPKEVEKVTETPQEPVREIREESALDKWVPKTQLGRDVFGGKITDIDEVLKSKKPIRESEIIDKLVPDLKHELILIGGRTGKGGGIQRIPVKITATMHRSGRRFSYSTFVVVGNENGLIGIAKGTAPETRLAIAKAIQKAKLNLIRVKGGCGSWECGEVSDHSISFKVRGKAGSVKVDLLPAPKGVGLVADNESKKILRLAGIKDVWVKTYGNSSMRINLISAVFDALRKLSTYEKVGE